jgi:hypothetical protein
MVQELVSVLNKHPIVTATFSGHDHTIAYTYLDATRIPAEGSFEGVTHPFHQFVNGGAGAGSGTGACRHNRCEFNMIGHGFMTVDVSGLDITVNWYSLGNEAPVNTLTITKEVTPTPFADVPEDHWARTHIVDLYEKGYVAGCSAEPLLFCPESAMTRAESAVFIERGLRGGGYLPPDPNEKIFTDVSLSEWFAKWAGVLLDDGYTEGCGMDPLIFCPLQLHTRAEATVFFERMLHGVDYLPPEPTTQVYIDVPVGLDAAWFSKWIMAAESDGLLQGCEDPDIYVEGSFRPLEELTRAESACMMSKVESNSAP